MYQWTNLGERKSPPNEFGRSPKSGLKWKIHITVKKIDIPKIKLGNAEEKKIYGKLKNQRKASKTHSSIDIHQNTENEKVAKQMNA